MMQERSPGCRAAPRLPRLLCTVGLATLAIGIARTPATLNAQTFTVSGCPAPYEGRDCRLYSGTITATVQSVHELQVSGADPLSFPSQTLQHFENGFVATASAASVQIRSNRNYRVSIERAPSANSYMQAVAGGASATKPSSHLRFKLGSALTGKNDPASHPLLESPTQLFTGNAGQSNWTTAQQVHFGLWLSFADTPGRYRQLVRYSVEHLP
jgi:hypothetical protein